MIRGRRRDQGGKIAISILGRGDLMQQVVVLPIRATAAGGGTDKEHSQVGLVTACTWTCRCHCDFYLGLLPAVLRYACCLRRANTTIIASSCSFGCVLHGF